MKEVLQQAQALLFDFDGVIGKTMNDNHLAWKAVMARQGISFDAQAYYRLEGLRPKDVAQRLTGLQDEETLLEMGKEKDREFLRIHQPALYPEVIPLLQRLRQAGKRLALVTGGSRSRVGVLLAAQGLQNQFDFVVTADDCPRPKPFGDPYEIALQGLGITREQGLVIENAPLGIASAKAAGIACVALCTTLQPADLQEADWILPHHQALIEFLFP